MWCCFILKLKNPHNNRLLLRSRKSVAPRPLFKGEASTVNINLSLDVGIVSERGDLKAACASPNAVSSCGVHVTCCARCIPLILSSRGDNRDPYRGMQRDIALNAPMKDFIAVHVFGLLTDARADIL